jgi:hypothetical protein
MRGISVSSRIGVIFVTGIVFAALTGGTALATPKDTSGASRHILAFYEGDLFTVNMFEVSASQGLLDNNSSVNTIYATNDLDEDQDFHPVIDAIQGEDFNPLWQQILIVFNEGFTPHQFVSEEEVLAAAAGDNPEITLIETDEVYLCAVVGEK